MRDRDPSRAPAHRALLLATAVALAPAVVVVPAAATAQGAPVAEARAVLRGRVVDATTRQPLEGAELRLTGMGERVVRSDADGAWRLERLAAGTWRVSVRRIGYVARTATVQLAPDETRVLDLALEAAALRLDQVVVTAARREQRLKDVAVTTELVSRSDIAQTGASDLAAVLTEQVGIQLDGGSPAGAGVMLQGLGSQRVLVLLDGQPVAGRVGGHFDISRIPAGVVERIEVVKGPQSTLYGSDAMGGVINIVTRTPQAHAFGGTAAMTAGSYGRLDGSAHVDLGVGPVALSVDGGRRSTELVPGRASLSGALAQRTDGAFRARWSADSGRWVEAGVLALDERQRWRDARLFSFGDNRQVTGRVGGGWRHGRHALTPTLSGSIYEHVFRQSEYDRPITGDTGQRQFQRVFDADLLYNATFGAAALDAGIEARHEDWESPRVPGGRRTVRQLEPFAQVELALGAVSVVPGVRLTANDLWGTRLTPRVAMRWRAARDVTVRAAAGQGFRAPGFNELYLRFPNGSYGIFGDSSLTPESSRNLSLGAEVAPGRWFGRVSIYRNELRDFIATVVDPAGNPEVPVAYRYANVDRARTQGADVEGAFTLPGVRLEAGYGWLHARDLDGDLPLTGRAPHHARLGASLALPLGLRASTTGLWTGTTPMRTGAAASERPAFTRLDARVARALPGGLELVVGADNVFDTQPAQWPGFVGRQLYTSVSFTFDRTQATR